MKPLALSIFLATSTVTAQMNFKVTTDKQEYRTGEAVKLAWELHNDSNRAWVVYKETAGGRVSFPQITFTIGSQQIVLDADAKASEAVACRLQPGHNLRVGFDLADWMTYLGSALPPGRYDISAIFEHKARDYGPRLQGRLVANCGSAEPLEKVNAPEVWDGSAIAPKITITIR
jgi:hypothetical protein